MSHQVAITVRTPVVKKQRDAVRGNDGLFAFARMAEVHFARLFILEEVTNLGGERIPASLVYMSDVDGPVLAHLRHLSRVAATGLDALFGHYVGYPTHPTAGSKSEWLERRILQASACYVHTVGRTVEQIRQEASLRQEVGRLVDGVDIPDRDADPRTVRRRVQELLLGQPEAPAADAASEMGAAGAGAHEGERHGSQLG